MGITRGDVVAAMKIKAEASERDSGGEGGVLKYSCALCGVELGDDDDQFRIRRRPARLTLPADGTWKNGHICSDCIGDLRQSIRKEGARVPDEDLVKEGLEALMVVIGDERPGDRSDRDRRYAIVKTELEKVYAYYVTYCWDGR